MITYEDIKPFIDAGATTAAEIVAAMQADRRRVKNIYVTGGPEQRDRLKHILGAQYGLFRKTLGNVFAGPIADWGKAPERTSNEQAVVDLLASYWDDSEAMFYCAENASDGWALDLLETVGTNVLGAQAGAALAADIDRISGGWLWSGVTESDIQSLLTDQAKQEAAAVLQTIKDNGITAEQSVWTTKQQEAEAAKEAVLAPARGRFNRAVAWISSFGDTDPVALQSRVDAVVNSADGNGDEAGAPPQGLI